MFANRMACYTVPALHGIHEHINNLRYTIFMANHKRHRNKSRRAGCLLCKPHKAQGNSLQAIKPKYRSLEPVLN